MSPADETYEVGEVYRSPSGWRWRVTCKAEDGSVLGLVPVGFWHCLKWRMRGVKW